MMVFVKRSDSTDLTHRLSKTLAFGFLATLTIPTMCFFALKMSSLAALSSLSSWSSCSVINGNSSGTGDIGIFYAGNHQQGIGGDGKCSSSTEIFNALSRKMRFKGAKRPSIYTTGMDQPIIDVHTSPLVSEVELKIEREVGIVKAVARSILETDTNHFTYTTISQNISINNNKHPHKTLRSPPLTLQNLEFLNTLLQDIHASLDNLSHSLANTAGINVITTIAIEMTSSFNPDPDRDEVLVHDDSIGEIDKAYRLSNQVDEKHSRNKHESEVGEDMEFERTKIIGQMVFQFGRSVIAVTMVGVLLLG